MRAIPYSPPSDDRDWEWLNELPDGRPRIHVTLGTIFNQDTRVFHAILEGLAEAPCSVLLQTDADVGAVPDNVYVRPFYPVNRVLPLTDLVVGHGGWGTTIAALAHGIPTLVLPQASDQFRNAVKLQAAGAGRFLADDVSPSRVAALVRVLLEDPTYRLNARRLRREIEAMPAPAACIPLLERLAVNKRPLRVPDPFSPGALPSSTGELMRRPQRGR
jgi:UDP:flavonoid glycosyltransferase YjiC (YdhE family)